MCLPSGLKPDKKREPGPPHSAQSASPAPVLASNVDPLFRLCVNASSPTPVGAARFVAVEENAIREPSALIRGSLLGPLACAPPVTIETRTATFAVRSRTNGKSKKASRLPLPMSKKKCVEPW